MDWAMKEAQLYPFIFRWTFRCNSLLRFETLALPHGLTTTLLQTCFFLCVKWRTHSPALDFLTTFSAFEYHDQGPAPAAPDPSLQKREDLDMLTVRSISSGSELRLELTIPGISLNLFRLKLTADDLKVIPKVQPNTHQPCGISRHGPPCHCSDGLPACSEAHSLTPSSFP